MHRAAVRAANKAAAQATHQAGVQRLWELHIELHVHVALLEGSAMEWHALIPDAVEGVRLDHGACTAHKILNSSK
jgi:hypothetical protein